MEIGKRPKRKKNDKQEELLQRISELTTDISYWKKQHDRARKREEKFKNELKDKKARIRYLEEFPM
ncbi:MAG: hypothetical protein JW976_02135 [Syntrophaceae bacterium]|nr:hypothetical protein [Syntrophaceae bacterium]